MRIFAAYLAHETNSFSPIPTSRKSFEELGIFRPDSGQEATAYLLKGARHFQQEALRRGDEVVVGLCAHSQPSSPSSSQTYQTLRNWLIEDLTNAGPVDAVMIMLHGSMMAQGVEDCDGDLLAAIREHVGPHVPVGGLLDLHCNITERMLDAATFLIACKEYPHTDFAERARELYELCAQVHAGKITPTWSHRRVPMLGLYQTTAEPMRSLVDAALAREKENLDVLAVTLAHGFPWSDFAEAGASVTVYTDNNQPQAQDLADSFARSFFDLREIGQARLADVAMAVDEAMAETGGTVVIADMADNPGGGAGSDSTFILRELIDRGADSALLGYFWDPVALQMAFDAGEGTRLPIRVGGKIGPFSGQPVDLDAEVICLRTDAYQPHIADGTSTPLGRTALIRSGGIEIVLNDIRQQPFSPLGLTAAGADPWSKKIIVVKSSHHFYAGFSAKAAKIIYCDAPGTLNSDATSRPYMRLRRPIWPLDPLVTEEVFDKGSVQYASQ